MSNLLTVRRYSSKPISVAAVRVHGERRWHPVVLDVAASQLVGDPRSRYETSLPTC